MHSERDDGRARRPEWRVAWIRAVSASLLPFADAGASRAPIARRADGRRSSHATVSGAGAQTPPFIGRNAVVG
jgi:hypothetical protein